MSPKAIDVKVLENYKLEIIFDNNEKRIFDVEPYLKNPLFQELKDKSEFEKVKIAGLSIEWEKRCRYLPWWTI